MNPYRTPSEDRTQEVPRRRGEWLTPSITVLIIGPVIGALYEWQERTQWHYFVGGLIASVWMVGVHATGKLFVFGTKRIP